MEINWFEISAQVINFIILLFILQKLFYKPVINAMNKRQEKITRTLQEAEGKMQEARDLISSYEKKMSEINHKEKQILEKAREEALETKEALIAAYKELANEKRYAYLHEIQEEKEGFLNELRRSLGKNSVRIASKVLSAIADADIEDKVFTSFLNKIKLLDSVMLSDEEDLILVSSDELPEEKRVILENALKEKLGAYKSLIYKKDENLILGYELKFETFSLHLNIRKYLQESEKSIMKMLDKKS